MESASHVTVAIGQGNAAETIGGIFCAISEQKRAFAEPYAVNELIVVPLSLALTWGWRLA
jgi:hypothetical protein